MKFMTDASLRSGPRTLFLHIYHSRRMCTRQESNRKQNVNCTTDTPGRRGKGRKCRRLETNTGQRQENPCKKIEGKGRKTKQARQLAPFLAPPAALPWKNFCLQREKNSPVGDKRNSGAKEDIPQIVTSFSKKNAKRRFFCGQANWHPTCNNQGRLPARTALPARRPAGELREKPMERNKRRSFFCGKNLKRMSPQWRTFGWPRRGTSSL